MRPLKAVGPSHSLRNEFAVDPLCQSQDDTRAALRAPVAATARDLGEAVHRTESGGGGRQARDLGEADRVECCGCSPPRRCVHLASWRRCGRAAKLMRAALGVCKDRPHPARTFIDSIGFGRLHLGAACRGRDMRGVVTASPGCRTLAGPRELGAQTGGGAARRLARLALHRPRAGARAVLRAAAVTLPSNADALGSAAPCASLS